ncbi:MAG: D-alanine--D-alanine ligase family protein [Ardenticatenaceae bacterium]|nr:D-alanine--D-alanine ligase family protein [Ardenticatenaceae bacterium]
MTAAPKLRVGVIFGGRSGEHEVSLRSARSVMSALDQSKYEVIPLGITKSGRWLAGNPMAALSAGPTSTDPAVDSRENQVVMLPPTPGEQQIINAETPQNGFALDVIIPVLHGTYGEDGTVQGLLELANVPYVGAGVVGSAVGMDKAIFKHVMTAHQIPILPWKLIHAQTVTADMARAVQEIEKALSYPVFTKPANLGSSVGIARCETRSQLEAGLLAAAAYDRRIVVEQGIDARELEVAVLGNEFPKASVVGEIRPKREFYDYEAKYITDDSELLIPAPLNEGLTRQVREMAVEAFQAIDCAGLGRVDFLLDRQTSALYINEINTMPGFTNISMYPKLWEASGLPYSELLDELIALALKRHEQRQSVSTDFTGAFQTA